MKITMEGTYQTRNGRKVQVLTVDRVGSPYTVVALVTAKNSEQQDVLTFTEIGEYDTGGVDTTNQQDLIEVPVAPLVFTDFLLEQGVDLELFWKNLGSKHHKFVYRTQTRKQYLKISTKYWFVDCFVWDDSLQKDITWRELNWSWKELVANKPANQEVIFGEFFRNKTNLKD